MKTVSNFVQIFALSACLVTYLQGSGDLQMAGVRRALQTMSGSASHAGFPDWPADGSVDSHLG
jgi:hypothetical protein